MVSFEPCGPHLFDDFDKEENTEEKKRKKEQAQAP